MISHKQIELCNSLVWTLHKLVLVEYETDIICDLIEYWERRF